ncbi:hypothetical protein F2Q70_00029102 [Brassica cretica]|uniref:Uncharacterized protein n=1 Tax=Brassica cretica TaxID=69181 RepID=A0A8S9FJE3_BRACR|nr:hypothetical protein F2Q70_00029102 [Brassica cretica]
MFTASELGLLFSQLFLFIPIEDFLLFRHWFVERRACLSRSASGSSWMFVDVFIGIVGDIARIQRVASRPVLLLRFAVSRGVSSELVKLAEGGLPSPFQQPVDLGGSASSVMDLRLYGSYFCRSLGDVVAKIADIRRLVSRFLSLSAFTASELGLLFIQLFLFVPIDDFLFFRHWFVERRAFLICPKSGRITLAGCWI